MNEKAAKGLLFFLVLMLFFTFSSWKLDALRTPRVLCTGPAPGVVGGTIYDMVLPSESIYSEEEQAYVYMVEDSRSYFYPVVARQNAVAVLASENGRSAVQGLYLSGQIVRFTDRTLSGGTVPVSLWEEELLAGRVEVVPFEDLDAAENILRQAAEREKRPWKISQEEDRLVVENADQFTARMAGAALAASGAGGTVLDYTWGPAVLAQSGRLWIVWAAALGLWLLWSLIFAQGRREWDLAQEALEEQYLGAYLADAGVRLLAEGIVLAVGGILTAAALQWLWQVEIVLPRDFLPQGSVFDVDHYRMWVRNTFPEGCCSVYGADLAADLRRCGILNGAGCGALTVAAVLLRKAIGLCIRRRS